MQSRSYNYAPLLKGVLFALLLVCSAYHHLLSQTLSQNSLAFGATGVGIPNRLSVTLQNTGQAPVRYIGSTFTGAGRVKVSWHDADDYNPFQGFDSAVIHPNPNNTRNLKVQMVPIGLGAIDLQCKMLFEDMAGNALSPVEYTITGSVEGAPSVSTPGLLDFGDVEVNQRLDATIVLKNTGTCAAHLYWWSKNPLHFYLSQVHPVIEPGDSVTLYARFYAYSEGIVRDTIVFSYFDDVIGDRIVIPIQGRGTFPASGLLSDRTTAEFILFDDHWEADTQAVEFRTIWPEVNIVSVECSRATAFRLMSQQLPYKATPTNPFVATVVWAPHTGSQIEHEDTLYVTTDNGDRISQRLEGHICASTQLDDNTSCVPHPNPTQGELRWCGREMEGWRICNAMGITIERVVASSDGTCRWTGEVPGYYLLVSERTGTATPFVVYE